MAVDPTPVFEDVLAYLRASQPLTVYDNEAPEDSEIVVTNGLFKPYLCVFTGGPIRSSSDHSIVTTRYDTTILYWSIEIYAPRAQDARLIKGSIVNLLTGYRPVDSGEITVGTGLAYSRASNEVRPTQYVESVGFLARSNLTLG